MTADTESAHEPLNEAMIARLRRWRSLRSDPIEAAIRAVSRHLFVPDVPLEEAYADDAVITKRHPDGSPQSSASEPGVVAAMLQQLDVRPGHRVLEIGAGTGYNAALLARMGASVTTVEYDAETADRARQALAEAGLPDVVVVTGDGADGYAERAPYDRLIVTTGAWEVAPAWLRQLGPDGRLVVPLRFPGWNWSMAFERAGDHWRSVSQHTCGFIPMEGSAGRPARLVRLAGGIRLAIEDDRVLDTGTLERAFAQPRQEVWTGVEFSHAAASPYDQLFIWLAGTAPGFCKFTADSEATGSGRIAPLFTWGGPMVCDGDSLAYLTNRRAGGQLWELGVLGHGPAGRRLADDVAEQARTWDREHREAEPRIELHLAGTPDHRLSGAQVIDKRDTRIAIFWS